MTLHWSSYGPVISRPIIGGPVISRPIIGGPVISRPIIGGPVICGDADSDIPGSDISEGGGKYISEFDMLATDVDVAMERAMALHKHIQPSISPKL